MQTPEEENARFLQGDTGEPAQGEDHRHHIQVHNHLQHSMYLMSIHNSLYLNQYTHEPEL